MGRLLVEAAQPDALDALPAFAPEHLATTARFFMDLVFLPPDPARLVRRGTRRATRRNQAACGSQRQILSRGAPAWRRRLTWKKDLRFELARDLRDVAPLKMRAGKFVL